MLRENELKIAQFFCSGAHLVKIDTVFVNFCLVKLQNVYFASVSNYRHIYFVNEPQINMLSSVLISATNKAHADGHNRYAHIPSSYNPAWA